MHGTCVWVFLRGGETSQGRDVRHAMALSHAHALLSALVCIDALFDWQLSLTKSNDESVRKYSEQVVELQVRVVYLSERQDGSRE